MPVCLERRVGVAVGEAHLVDLAVAADLELQPVRKGVDHRDADAVQAARDLVGILVEFPAGMELGHDDLGRRDAFAGVDVGGDAAAVVDDGHRAVGIERHRDEVGMAGQRLVDGVVDDLVDHVVQARAVIGVADVHAGALAHRVEALEDLDGIGAIFVGIVGRRLDGSGVLKKAPNQAAKPRSQSSSGSAESTQVEMGIFGRFSRTWGISRTRVNGLRVKLSEGDLRTHRSPARSRYAPAIDALPERSRRLSTTRGVR